MSEETIAFNPPRGMRDFYPEDMVLRERIFDAWRAAARRFGFAAYDACVVENLDLLQRKAGEEIVDQIYAFTDKSGRPLALRPEMTPTLARMVAARQGSLVFPLKWYAIAQCFRYERMTRGRKREHYQWNLDIVGGERSAAAELEVMSAASCAMSLLGLGAGDYRIHFSSRALLADLLAAGGIEPAHHPAVFMALDKRGKMEDAAIRELLKQAGLDETAASRVFDLTAVATLEDAAARLPAGSPALDEVNALWSLAGSYGMRDVLHFDIGVIRGLAYYTGIVFEAFDVGRKFRAIFGGGRYDSLLSAIGGAPATAVGLGFGDVVVGEILADRGLAAGDARPDTVAVGFMDAAQHPLAAGVAAALRREGRNVDLALAAEKPKKFFGRVGKGGFAEAAYLGPDDAAAGSVRVKNLLTREERSLALGGR